MISNQTRVPLGRVNLDDKLGHMMSNEISWLEKSQVVTSPIAAEPGQSMSPESWLESLDKWREGLYKGLSKVKDVLTDG